MPSLLIALLLQSSPAGASECEAGPWDCGKVAADCLLSLHGMAVDSRRLGVSSRCATLSDTARLVEESGLSVHLVRLAPEDLISLETPVILVVRTATGHAHQVVCVGGDGQSAFLVDAASVLDGRLLIADASMLGDSWDGVALVAEPNWSFASVSAYSGLFLLGGILGWVFFRRRGRSELVGASQHARS